MQKILIALLGLLLTGIFFFIQNNKEEENDTHAPVQEKVEKEVLNHTPQSTSTKQDKEIDHPQSNKPFKPKINLKQEATDKTFTEADKKDLESKSQRELQKDIFADIQTRMTTEMQSIPNCLENAQNKQEAVACNKKLQDINKEFELLLGINTDNTAKNDTRGFVWNETTKENMIKELDAGIEPMQKMFSCLQSADNDEEQEKCFQIDEKK